MLFAQVIGQEQTSEDLRQLWQQGRMPHSLLLAGAEGCGKLALALALAQYLLCEQRTDTDACGQCAACRKMEKLVHPDVHFAFPVVGSKVTSDQHLKEWRSAVLDNPYLNVHQWLQQIGAENKQGNINKDECQAIIRKLSLKTFESNSKILLIWLPEFLGKEGNRLLKIIEEPPEDTYFLLVTENTELILNTILSRCQLVKVQAIPEDAIVSGLQHYHPGIEPTARNIAFLANGNFNAALELANTKDNDRSKSFIGWLRKCYKGNGVELVQWVEQFAKIGRENQKYFLLYGLQFLRSFLMLKVCGETAVRLPDDELKHAINLKTVLEVDQVEHLVALFTDTVHHIERNGNPKIVMLDCSIQLHKTIRRK